MTSTDLRLPATELSKLEPARPGRLAYVEPPSEPVAAPHRLRRAVRTVVGYARA